MIVFFSIREGHLPHKVPNIATPPNVKGRSFGSVSGEMPPKAMTRSLIRPAAEASRRVSGGKPSVVRTNISGYCSEPVWNKVNPDLIAFTIAQGKGFQVAVYNFRTKQTKVVSRGASTSGPKWLNDGRHIICTKSNGVNRQLYIIDTETDSQKPLHTTSFGSAKEPDFVYTAR